jgi:hypothetical protein
MALNHLVHKTPKSYYAKLYTADGENIFTVKSGKTRVDAISNFELAKIAVGDPANWQVISYNDGSARWVLKSANKRIGSTKKAIDSATAATYQAMVESDISTITMV